MTSTDPISLQLRQAFAKLIAQKIGIQIRAVEQETLTQKICLRIKALSLANPKQYYQLLSLPGAEGEAEWQNLAELLTNNESYFFRDRQQLDLLKNQIFPQLIRLKRQQENLTLRVWSAGCSTGQEPYSLAIILKELLLDLDAWNLSIFGTDIDLTALNKGRAGIYSEWSFRDTEPRIKQQYFAPVAQNYQITPIIRQMVTWQKLNLLQDQFPQLFSPLKEIDLIVCRNVFIYFSQETISEILAKFYNTLRPGGYILVGHSELAGQNLSGFQAQIFPQSLIYQRRVANLVPPPPLSPLKPPPIKTQALPISKPIQVPSIPQPVQTSVGNLDRVAQSKSRAKEQRLLQQAQHLWQQKQSNLAIKKVQQILARQPENIAAYCLLGTIYLAQKQLDLAIAISNRAMAINSLNLGANYLLAEIALYQDDLETAKKIFKKILYLDPESLKAPLELQRIYQRTGDRLRASKMAHQAIKLLEKRPNSQVLPDCNNLSVAELIFQLKTNA